MHFDEHCIVYRPILQKDEEKLTFVISSLNNVTHPIYDEVLVLGMKPHALYLILEQLSCCVDHHRKSMSRASEWSWEENKVFEEALATHYEYVEKGEWEKLAPLIPTKTPSQICMHFKHLLEDIEVIELMTPLPTKLLHIPLRYHTNEHSKHDDCDDGRSDLEEGEGSSTEG